MPDRDRRAEARGALLHGRKGGRAVTALAPHIPVLLDEVVDALAIAPGERHVDATFGAGGYTRAMLAHGATVIAFDRDPDAIAEGRALVAESGDRLILVEAPFSALDREIEARDLAPVDGVAVDIEIGRARGGGRVCQYG